MSSSLSIAQFVSDLGKSTTYSTSSFRNTLQQIPMNEQQMASLIAFFAMEAKSTDSSSLSSSSSDSNDLSATLVNSLLTPPNSSSNSNSSSNTPNTPNAPNTSNSWNYQVISQVFSEDYPTSLNWLTVASFFDVPTFQITSQNSLSVLLKLYTSGSSLKSLPPAFLFGDWHNPHSQLTLLTTLTSANCKLYTFPTTNVEQEEILAFRSPNTSDLAKNNAFGSIHLATRLLHLSELLSPQPQLYNAALQIFIKGINLQPEIVMLTMIRVQHNQQQQQQQQQNQNQKQKGAKLCGEVMSRLLPLFFKPNGSKHTKNLMERLWKLSPTVVMNGIIESWRSTKQNNNSSNSNSNNNSNNNNNQSHTPSQILTHIANIVASIPTSAKPILQANNAEIDYHLPLAFKLADKELKWFPLETYLVDCINSKGAPFATDLITYIGNEYLRAVPRAQVSQMESTGGEAWNNDNNGSSNNSSSNNKHNAPISIENIWICLKALNGNDTKQTMSLRINNVVLSDSAKQLTTLITNRVGQNPTAGGSGAASPASGSSASPASPNLGAGTTPANPVNNEEIEEMANSYFQKIYTSEQSIGEVSASF